MRQLPLSAVCLVVPLFLVTAFGCRKNDKKSDEDPSVQVDPHPKDDFGLTAEEKRWWIEKAARTLHNGQGTTDDDEITRLSQMTYTDIVGELMQDERFYDVALDFDLFYLGLKSDRLGFPKKGDLLSVFSNVTSIPQAVEGALRLRENGDFVGALMAERSRIFASPTGPAIDFENGTTKSDEESRILRIQAYKALDDRLTNLMKDVAADPTPIPDRQFCDAFFTAASLNAFELSIPDVLRDAVQGMPIMDKITAHCSDEKVDAKVMNPLLLEFQASIRKLVDYVAQFEGDVYWPQTVKDIKALDLAQLNIPDQSQAQMAMGWFWGALPNSSTNFDRKRANYVLKRYFCDDLTPISVVLPKDHAEGKHAADPGCQACHYKLDPMAGFFRSRGADGTDYADRKGESPQIYFDDGAHKNLREYLATWDAPEGTGRHWDIGYVRSTTNPELNTYATGDSPNVSDLFAMIQGAPEAKQCLVRRMFEYFIGQNQVVDSGYLEHLTQNFVDKSTAETSSAAFKDTVVALVTSGAFRAKDPISEQCYDRAPGDTTAESDRPPCRVAFILQKNCEGCHKGEGAAGGLDLSQWQLKADGKHGFTHRGADGQDVPTAESLKRMYDRLVSTDPTLRMPLNREFPVADRDALFLWINQTLEAGK